MADYVKTENICKNCSLDICITKGKIAYVKDKTHTEQAHIHSNFELYINISGDVSFLVENKLYPISRGDIIITMPNEIHHCVYNSTSLHEDYCIWINAQGDMAKMLNLDTNRNKGEHNLISMTKEDKQRAIKLIQGMKSKYDAKSFKSPGALAELFSLFSLIGKYSYSDKSAIVLPELLEDVLKYIDTNLGSECSGEKIASEFYISRATLYRMFKTHLNISPAKYIEAKRLSLAKEMLEKKKSIQEVYSTCGFNDYSHFISIFKKRFGTTPHKYIKETH